MPRQWSDDLYCYTEGQVKHTDIAALDPEGRWFECKFCTNPRNAKGRFTCKLFGSSEIIGDRGHITTTTHKEKKAQHGAGAACMALLQAGGEGVQPAGEPQQGPAPALVLGVLCESNAARFTFSQHHRTNLCDK